MDPPVTSPTPAVLAAAEEWAERAWRALRDPRLPRLSWPDYPDCEKYYFRRAGLEVARALDAAERKAEQMESGWRAANAHMEHLRDALAEQNVREPLESRISILKQERDEYMGRAQALENLYREARECWEPGHVWKTEPPGDEERREIRVHCVRCTDAAMARAEQRGRDAERARIVADDPFTRTFHAGTRVTNCVAHMRSPMTERPDDCRLCLTDLRNHLRVCLRANEWLNTWKEDALAALRGEEGGS